MLKRVGWDILADSQQARRRTLLLLVWVFVNNQTVVRETASAGGLGCVVAAALWGEDSLVG